MMGSSAHASSALQTGPAPPSHVSSAVSGGKPLSGTPSRRQKSRHPTQASRGSLRRRRGHAGWGLRPAKAQPVLSPVCEAAKTEPVLTHKHGILCDRMSCSLFSLISNRQQGEGTVGVSIPLRPLPPSNPSLCPSAGLTSHLGPRVSQCLCPAH